MEKPLCRGNIRLDICQRREDYIQKEKNRMPNAPVYGEEYTLRQNVSMEKRMQQKEELLGKIGYID